MFDLRWLCVQRQALGPQTFRNELATHLDPESIANLLAMLDQADADEAVEE